MLDKAIAKYNKTIDEIHCFNPKDCRMCAEEKIALDAAVRAVALAAVGLFPHTQTEYGNTQVALHHHARDKCQWCKAEAEIKRLLPDTRQETAGAEDKKEHDEVR